MTRPTMRAAIATGYGGPDVVELRDLAVPVPGPGQVLVRVMATTLSAGDWRIRSRNLPRGMGVLAPIALGFRRPRRPVLGVECAGEVAATGSGVTEFATGDAVVGMAGMAMGCHAEYVLLPAAKLIPKPAALDWDQAGALCFGGTTALAFLDAGGLRAGHHVLVIGATGVVGSAAVQIARAAGAHVTVTARPADAGFVRDIGADTVIDNRATDLAHVDTQWDLILDAPGVETWARMRPRLRHQGRFLRVAADLPAMLHAGFTRGDRRPVALTAPERQADMLRLAAMAKAGTLRPTIDSRYALEDICAAHVRADRGHKRGAIVIRIG